MGKLSSKKRGRVNRYKNNVNKNSEHEYQVEAIVDKRVHGKKIEYLLKWQGYSSTDNTWEDVSRLNCPDLIREFEERSKVKNNQRKSSPRKRSTSTKAKNTNMHETDEDYRSDTDQSMDTENDVESTGNYEDTRMATRNSPRKKVNTDSSMEDSSSSSRRHSSRKTADQTKTRITTMYQSTDNNNDEVDNVIEEIVPPSPKRKKTSNEKPILVLEETKFPNEIASPQKTPTRECNVSEPTTINLCLHISPSSSSSISVALNDNDNNNNPSGKVSTNIQTSEQDIDESDRVDKIEAVRYARDEIAFRIKLINENRSQWISARVANRKYPQAIIAFWENHVQFI
ncbi:unnamed protein product [Adineta ricciae]|uniref:Chromo domain-containing protein n=1 Tax=Adineta ricciae TaxID=249248 RepID=A0A813R140_ADIRI|nr:unnamed protein product [Adineta ricciae]CAF0774499.1 unnamed protein product [Adineta ricciae]